MSYILEGVTLPQPKKFSRTFIETSSEHLLLFGKTTKKVENRKEQFVLEYQNLSINDVNVLLSLYELNKILTFQINETQLIVAETDVLMDISTREYPNLGASQREDLNIILTEVM